MTRASEPRELIGCLSVDPDQPGVCGLRSPAPSLWASLSYREASWIVHPFREGEDAPVCSAELASVRLHVNVVHQTPDDEMKSVELIITMCSAPRVAQIFVVLKSQQHPCKCRHSEAPPADPRSALDKDMDRASRSDEAGPLKDRVGAFS